MSTYRESLLAAAKDAGLEFPSNVKTEKLESLLTEGGFELPEKPADDPGVMAAASSPKPANKSIRQVVSEAKKKAMTKRIVTITNKDPREASVVTSAYLSFQNAHFSMARVIPLDTPIELEECLISVAKSTTITLHKQEIKDGRNTGNHVPVVAKKYAISYQEQQ